MVGVEGSPAATADAKRNTQSMAWVDIVTSSVDPAVLAEVALGVTHVVLDPPRRGVVTKTLEALVAIESLERIVSVSCDAATFARDLRLMMDAGFVLEGIRAFDLFEMTEHLEIIAVLTRGA